MAARTKKSPSAPRRLRVPDGSKESNKNIYQRPDGKFEIGYRDSSGTQRWKVIDGGIKTARAERDTILGARGRGERVQPSPRLRFGDAYDRWLAEHVAGLRERTRDGYKGYAKTHLLPR